MDGLKPPAQWSMDAVNLSKAWKTWKEEFTLYTELALPDAEEKARVKLFYYLIGERGRELCGTLIGAEARVAREQDETPPSGVVPTSSRSPSPWSPPPACRPVRFPACLTTSLRTCIITCLATCFLIPSWILILCCLSVPTWPQRPSSASPRPIIPNLGPSCSRLEQRF
ncbi:uncharacterized protein [Nothobranchius furzeri]|uniref:uncharacterized protein isoform X2 n=1 Tax=Nothobranchius furzeri TaxID=105023 RepID=UPI002403C047|nr:uncharacterized protein LOC129164243 isoform X3 [Nothobranchius furzeri]